jgi:hypothetical protein
MSSNIQKFVLKTNKGNKYGNNKSINKYKGKDLAPPLKKYKVNKNQWFTPSSKVFNHKKIQTPVPTPVSVKTGDRVEKSRSTKQIEKIQSSCQPNGGKTTMKCI